MNNTAERRTPEDFFADFPEGLRILTAVEGVMTTLGPVDIRVTKSQIAFTRRKGFAYLWRPGQYVASTVPAALAIALPYALVSKRFKSVVHPSENVWMHHIELRDASEVDEQVAEWLRQAFEESA